MTKIKGSFITVKAHSNFAPMTDLCSRITRLATRAQSESTRVMRRQLKRWKRHNASLPAPVSKASSCFGEGLSLRRWGTSALSTRKHVLTILVHVYLYTILVLVSELWMLAYEGFEVLDGARSWEAGLCWAPPFTRGCIGVPTIEAYEFWSRKLQYSITILTRTSCNSPNWFIFIWS